ncbi:hypothetical protein HYS95_01910 [Candidatus Daviesbacteria bacterium]|nr:hypothetical protein [Candidatus Daviesbacteria bacterium]
MEERRKIELYESSSGDKPVEGFFASLDEKANSKIVHAFKLLKEFGLEGGYPHIKKLTGTNLWEYSWMLTISQYCDIINL